MLLKILSRLLVLILFFVPLGLLAYHNSDYFLQTVSLAVPLGEPLNIHLATPPLINGFYWIASLFVGMLLSAALTSRRQIHLQLQLRKAKVKLEESKQRELKLKQRVQNLEREKSSLGLPTAVQV